MLDRTPPRETLEVVLTRLHEAHDVSAYEAVDRLVRAGEAAGFEAKMILRMLDQGMAFQNLLELIVSKSVPAPSSAPPESKRRYESAQPAQQGTTVPQLAAA